MSERTALAYWPNCPVCGRALSFGGAEGHELICALGHSLDLGPADPADDWADFDADDSWPLGDEPLDYTEAPQPDRAALPLYFGTLPAWLTRRFNLGEAGPSSN